MKEARNNDTLHDENRLRVIRVAQKAFQCEGIKGVTMDDIAHRLSMSKRTLYQLFTDKEDLLLACVQEHHRSEHERMNRLAKEIPNVLEVILTEFKSKMNNFEKMSPAFVAELGKYPRVIAYLQTRRKAETDEAVSFFERGIGQGFFREGVNFKIVFPVIQQQVDFVMSQADFRDYSLLELFSHTVMITIRGCTTLKGAAIMDEFMEGIRKSNTLQATAPAGGEPHPQARPES